MTVRTMHPADIPEVSYMVMESFLLSVAAGLSEQGIATFRSLASEQAFAERLNGANDIWVVEKKREIRGMIELRERRHISMLFVAPRWQRTGVGRALVGEALKHCTAEDVTVNASLTSVGAYRSYGFEIDGPEAEREGLRYRPLRKPLPRVLSSPAPTTAD